MSVLVWGSLVEGLNKNDMILGSLELRINNSNFRMDLIFKLNLMSI